MSRLPAEIRALRTDIAREEALRQRENDQWNRFLAVQAQKPLSGRTKGNERETYTDTTFLLIRAFEGDTGARPLAAGSVFWNSPDVELYEGSELIATNQLKQGRAYTVQVNVTNLGDLAAPTCLVDLYICNPSLLLTMANARLLGVQSTHIAPHSTEIVRFGFTASAKDIGHRCLFARAYSTVTRDLPLDADQFDTVADRHIGQQNLSVVKQGELLQVEWSPLLAANLHLTIEPTAAPALPILARLPLGRAVRFRPLTTAPGRFELFEAAATAPLQARLAELVALKKKVLVGPVSAKPLLSVFGNQLKIWTPSRPNQWALPALPAGRPRLVKATIDVPYLQLQPQEAAVYKVELKTDKGTTVGGITLVVTA